MQLSLIHNKMKEIIYDLKAKVKTVKSVYINGEKIKNFKIIRKPMTTQILVNNENSDLPVVIPGLSYQIYYSDGNINNKKIHVRAIVDEDRVVYRSWSKRKGWVYSVESLYYFELLKNDGHLRTKK